MNATVYTSQGGRAFHGDRDCQARRSGRDLNDWDFNNQGFYWVPGCRALNTYAVEPMTIPAAMGAGKLPCAVCLPTALALPATGETYGHEPVTEDDLWGTPFVVCARCTEGGARWGWDNRLIRVPWPCTSAVVLGLVPRAVTA